MYKFSFKLSKKRFDYIIRMSIASNLKDMIFSGKIIEAICLCNVFSGYYSGNLLELIKYHLSQLDINQALFLCNLIPDDLGNNTLDGVITLGNEDKQEYDDMSTLRGLMYYIDV